jgi:hypothetical protein
MHSRICDLLNKSVYGVKQETKYRVFAERRNRVILLLSACASLTPKSLPEKKDVREISGSNGSEYGFQCLLVCTAIFSIMLSIMKETASCWQEMAPKPQQ